MKYIIANWKAHKTLNEAREWIELFTGELEKDRYSMTLLEEKRVAIILCPPYHLLSTVQELKIYPNIFFGAQTISTEEPGCYTGEVPAALLTPLVQYTIVGHSERRNIFHESEPHILTKIELAQKAAIEPILCLRGQQDTMHSSVKYIAYEPEGAIGTGNNASLDHVLSMKHMLNIQSHQNYIYGGSVTPDNSGTYLNHPEIDGVLPGKASLDPIVFHAMLKTVK